MPYYDDSTRKFLDQWAEEHARRRGYKWELTMPRWSEVVGRAKAYLQYGPVGEIRRKLGWKGPRRKKKVSGYPI